MLKTVIRTQNNMVMVFDEKGEQVPGYQGLYEAVRGLILNDAPVRAVFAHGFTAGAELRTVSRENW